MNKINILLATFVMTLGLNSCAHHDNAVSHHHHEEAPKKASYEGKCAYSVENKNFDVQGNPEFNIEHDGILYYFSSEQNMNEFKKDLNKHIAAANRSWEVRSARGR